MQLGLVSEVVPAGELLYAAERLAAIFAAQPPLAVQATLRTIWAARDLHANQATELGNAFLQLGTSQEALVRGQATFNARPSHRAPHPLRATALRNGLARRAAWPRRASPGSCSPG